MFTLGAFLRRDEYNYYPSKNPFADLGPSDYNWRPSAQYRTLTNAGLRSDISYVKGIHNMKAGAAYEHTFLKENDNLGIVDPTFLPSFGCTDPITGSPTGPPCTDLAPFDLTRPGAGLSGSAGTRTLRSSLFIFRTRSLRGAGPSISACAAISITD